MYLYMYLTWKGKRASIQGIELASVARVTSGLATDVLKRTGRADRGDCYLSLVTADRSLDLCFDDAAERASGVKSLSVFGETTPVWADSCGVGLAGVALKFRTLETRARTHVISNRLAGGGSGAAR